MSDQAAQNDRLDALLARLVEYIGEDNVSTFTHESTRRGLSGSTRGARDDRGLVFESA